MSGGRGCNLNRFATPSTGRKLSKDRKALGQCVIQMLWGGVLPAEETAHGKPESGSISGMFQAQQQVRAFGRAWVRAGLWAGRDITKGTWCLL